MDDSGEPLRARVAANVRAEMGRRGIKARQLARLIDMRPTTMFRRLNDEHPFRIDELGAVADALHVDIETLVTSPPRVRAAS